MDIKAIFLDFGGTLARRNPGIWEVFIETSEKHDVTLTREELDWARSQADEGHRSIDFLTLELMDTFWVDWFRLMLENLEIEGGEKLAREIYRDLKRESTIDLYPEVNEVLDQLEEGFNCIGIVSNYNCRLEPICRELGIANRFQFILASDVVGFGKPDARIFQLASSLAQVNANQCLHVGDSFGSDYVGARNAGLKALLLDRDGENREISDAEKIPDLRAVPERCL